MIEVSLLSKTYRVAKRPPGALAAFRALFHREYEQIRALRDVSFSIGEGEIVGYIGPNGAGKSTTIKIMSGILTPDGGECRILDRVPWKQRREHVGKIGVVFGQRTQLWWDVPVSDSFDMLRDIYQVPRGRFKESLDELAQALDIGDILHTPLRQLSLGQRMRCEIAGSLLHAPPILFLDEPTIGLDAVSKLAVRAFLKRINKERGVTIILTTHDMNDIEALTDRILLIGKGQLLYDGSLLGIRERYDTQRELTAHFAPGPEPLDIPGAQRLLWQEGRASYAMPAERIPSAIAYLGERLTLTDVTAQGASVEDIIASLYREHGI